MTVNNDEFFGEVIALLREGKNVTIPVKGESMLPFIVGGVDSVVLEGVDGGSPAGSVLRTANVGDVVLFRADGRLRTTSTAGFSFTGSSSKTMTRPFARFKATVSSRQGICAHATRYMAA